MNHQGRLLWLAGLDKDGSPHFPMLREECTQSDDWGHQHLKANGITCSGCQGRGWVPVDNLNTTLEAARTIGFVGVSGYQLGDHHWQVVIAPNAGLPAYGVGQTLNEAAVLALYRAMGGEQC